MFKTVTTCLLALIMSLLLVSVASAQSTGSVTGLVKDPQGAGVPNAQVILTNAATNFKLDIKTDGDGRFVFSYVQAANYTLTVQKDGFRTLSVPLTVEVAAHLDLPIVMELGKISETVTVVETAIAVNTTNGELAHEVSGTELHQLPLLNQNYYSLMLLTPGAVDTGSVTGDTRGGSNAGGGGISVGGARTSSVNFMLDGADNNDTFVAGVGQNVPLDAVQEFKVQTHGATAEYGRNAVVTNVITKSGTNTLHASAYEVYRGAALSTTPYDDKASGNAKSNFVRNQFGGSIGGHFIKDKFFYFGSMEGIRVRSSTTNRFYVPTQDFLSNASDAVNTYMNAYGLPSSNCNDSPITAGYIWSTTESNSGAYGLLNAKTGALIPEETQLFCRTAVRAPTDGGGGTPQNTWLTTGKFDYLFSSKTTLSGRYSYSKLINPVGAGSTSPYAGFSTPATAYAQNLGVTLQHTFSTNLFSEFHVSYNRVNPYSPLGKAPGNSPCWQYNGSFFGNTPTGDLITFPGYLPGQCYYNGLDAGGPQNVYSGSGSMTWVKGRHTIKFGASYLHMRHNYTFGAYENGYYESETMNDMLAGSIIFFAQALNPQGHVPGEVYDPAVDGAFGPPAFTRHYRYNEPAAFIEDTLRLTPRLTVTAGLRYEYFGVPHSPHGEQQLDANLYLNATGTTTTSSPIYNQVQTARFRRTTQFYNPDYKDLGPRFSLAYDVTGNGRTVLRGGYGLYYDRNFGNATFNAIQNPPNYAVFTGNSTDYFAVPFTINVNEYQMLTNAAAAGGGSFTVSSSARMLNKDMKTAYSEQWNATIEHNILGRGIIVSASYLGSNGIHLYSLNNLNQRGSCLLLLSIDSGPCSSTGPGSGGSYRINRSGLTGMNRRANEGLSRYHGLALELKTQDIGKTGLMLFSTYTLSHSIDNESSFFGDSLFEGNWGFGFRDGYNPSADRATSSNDIRNRFTLSGIWQVPFMKSQQGFAGHVLGGWSVSAIFQAQTGGAFSIYDGSSVNPDTGLSVQCDDSGTNFCYPVLTGSALPKKIEDKSTTRPNVFTLYDLSKTSAFQTQRDYCYTHSLNTPLGPFGNGASVGETFGSLTYGVEEDNYACSAALANLYPGLTGARNTFRTPGLWNTDAAIAKEFRLPWENHRLQFRADFINLFNHANLYADAITNAYYSDGGAVLAHKGTPNSGGKERRNIQLSLRYSF